MVRVKNIRLKQYNYQWDGYYFVTIVADKRHDLLQGREGLIKDELSKLEADIPGLKIDYYIVMSNHIHVILIFENCNLKLGEVVRRLKAKISFMLKEKIWQPNYYEHVIRSEDALEKIREYIIYNPELELLKFDKLYKDVNT